MDHLASHRALGRDTGVWGMKFIFCLTRKVYGSQSGYGIIEADTQEAAIKALGAGKGDIAWKDPYDVDHDPADGMELDCIEPIE